MPQPWPRPALATGGLSPSMGPSSARSYRKRCSAARRLAALRHRQWRHRRPCASRDRAPRSRHLDLGPRAQAARTAAPPPAQPHLDRRHDWRAARPPRHRQAVWPTAEDAREEDEEEEEEEEEEEGKNQKNSEIRRFDRMRPKMGWGRVTCTGGPRWWWRLAHSPEPGVGKSCGCRRSGNIL